MFTVTKTHLNCVPGPCRIIILELDDRTVSETIGKRNDTEDMLRVMMPTRVRSRRGRQRSREAIG